MRLVEDPATERDAEERRRDLLLLAALDRRHGPVYVAEVKALLAPVMAGLLRRATAEDLARLSHEQLVELAALVSAAIHGRPKGAGHPA